MATYAVQTILVPRSHPDVRNVATARKVAKRYARGDAARVGKVDTTPRFYRFRVRAPGEFRASTFRTYTSPSGVEVVSAVQKTRSNPRGRRPFTRAEARALGTSLGVKWTRVDLGEFLRGINEELEHGRRAGKLDVTHDDPRATARIALAHLREDPRYYTRMAACVPGAKDAAAREVRHNPLLRGDINPSSVGAYMAFHGRGVPEDFMPDEIFRPGYRGGGKFATNEDGKFVRVARKGETLPPSSSASPRRLGKIASGRARKQALAARKARETERKKAHARKRAPGIDPEYIERHAEARAAAARAGKPWIPSAPGVEQEHARGRVLCAPDHPMWEEMEDALEDARERAAMQNEDEGPPDDAAIAAILRKHPSYPKWVKVESDCVKSFLKRHGKARGATHSAAREARQRRDEAVAAGVDVTSAEYLDTLSPRGRASALRRLGRVNEARNLERSIRAGQTRGDKAERRAKARAKRDAAPARQNPASGAWSLTMTRNDRHGYRLPVRLVDPRGKVHRAYYNASTGSVNGEPPMSTKARSEMHTAARKAYRELYPKGHPDVRR